MIINRFFCKNLGGIIDRELELAHGMNVILGPNEAGKSTIVDGILGTLFRSHRLRKTVADKEFEEKYRPYPYGDSMNCRLVFTTNGKEYMLAKEWGANPQLSLTLEGQVMKDEKAVLAKVQELLKYGEGTYTNVVFARQRDLRIALDKLQRDEETGHALGDVLHQGVMALDGISLERLKKRIEEEYTELQGHWDLAQGRPEKGRGLDDPWRIGKGIVLDSYYKQEELYRKINLTRQLEDEYSAAVEKLREITTKREKVKAAKDKYAALEDDISGRMLLENELSILEKEAAELKEIIQQKPIKEAELVLQKRELERLEEENKKIAEELKLAERIEKAKAYQQLLQRSVALEKEIEVKKRALAELALIPEKQLKRLEELHNHLNTTKSTLHAATLQASLLSSPQTAYVTRGLKEREIIAPGREFSASGFFRLETEDGLLLEVRAGKIDFDALSREFTVQKAEYQEILQQLQVKDLVEAKQISASRTQLSRDLQILETKLTELSQGRDMAAIKKEVEETADLSARSAQELRKIVEDHNELIREAKVKAALLQSTLANWLQKYGDLNRILETFAQHSSGLEEKRKKLAGLAPLPEEFRSSTEFQAELGRLRKLNDYLTEEEKTAQKNCFEREGQLPDVTLEELQVQYSQAKAEFVKQEHRLQKVWEIRQVFQEKSSEMDRDSYLPLMNSFSHYLALLTLDKYEAGQISESLDVKIIRPDKVLLPSHLLSTGTSDVVLLALRLSLLETLFPKQGVVVLDDCLVNLDPPRKVKAAQVLQEFADRYQVIFTTCDPQTAEILGGNLLRL